MSSTVDKIIGRSTGEVIVIILAATVCIALLALGLQIAVLELTQPERDTTPEMSVLSDAITTLIGIMAGFLAGKNDAAHRLE